MSNGFVVVMGLATVFIGLICIIFVCSLMSTIVRHFEKSHRETEKASVSAPIPQSTQIADRDKIVVAISAAIAEEIGESAGAIRIKSLRRI